MMQQLEYTCSMTELSGLIHMTKTAILDEVREARKEHGCQFPGTCIYNAPTPTKKQFDKLIDCGFVPVFKYQSRHGDGLVTTFMYDGDMPYTYDPDLYGDN